MAAATANRAKFFKPADKVAYPVAASTKLFKDTMVFANTAGDLIPARTGTSTDLFMGFVEGQHDNSTGIAGAIEAAVLKEGTCAVVYGPGSPTKAVNGVKMYASDDQTVTTVATGAQYVGEGIYDPDPDILGKGMIRIRINKAVN